MTVPMIRAKVVNIAADKPKLTLDFATAFGSSPTAGTIKSERKMSRNRLTINGNRVTITTLTFGDIELQRKEVRERFDPKKGYIWLQGTNLLLTDEETERLRSFLAIK